MEKIRAGLIVFVLMVSAIGAIAYNIGDTITQEQFDNIDFSKQSLDISFTGKERAGNSILVNFNYTTLEDKGNGSWEIMEESGRVAYPMDYYISCRQGGATKATCVSEAKQWVKQKVIRFRNREREKLAAEQGKTDYSNELQPSDFDISNEEVN